MYYYQYPYPHFYPKNPYFPVYPYRRSMISPEYRPFPPVDPTLFTESAEEMQQLMKEASIILKKLSESKEFASEVMVAAQEGKMEQVEKLLKSTGVHAGVDVHYNPDGINMKLASSAGGTECCHLTIALRWRV